MNTGIFYSIVASVLFSLLPAYLQLLPPIHSFVVIGQRIIWTIIIMSIFLMRAGQVIFLVKQLIRKGSGLILMMSMLLSFFAVRYGMA